MKYFVYFPDINGYWANRGDNIDRMKFQWYILQEKLLYKDIRDTFRCWFINVFKNGEEGETSQKITDRIHERLKKIDDLIDKAICKGYLSIARQNIHGGELKTDWKGKDFIKFLPFCEACLNEYPHSFTIIASLIGSGLVATIITKWNAIIGYFV